MEPEYESVEAFVEFSLDDDVVTFTSTDLRRLAQVLHLSDAKVASMLRDYGMSPAPRTPVKTTRGYRSNSHDRWYGPGSSPSHGGSGWEQITGFAGQEG